MAVDARSVGVEAYCGGFMAHVIMVLLCFLFVAGDVGLGGWGPLGWFGEGVYRFHRQIQVLGECLKDVFEWGHVC